MSEQDEARSAQYLLESLTPGGSEYYNNPKRCAEWIETRLSEAQRLTMQAYKQRNEARDALDALRAENARLREALIDVGGTDAAGDNPCWCDGGPEHTPECRQASAALAGSKEPGDG